MTSKSTTRLVREGSWIAEVDVNVIENDHEWSPYLSGADLSKFDEVRLALRRGDVKAAAKFGRVFALTPIAAE